MPYLFAAMVVIWLLAFGYLVYLSRRAQGLEQEIRALEESLRDLGES